MKLFGARVGKKNGRWLFWMLHVFLAVSVPAQSPCTQELAAANQKYGDGDFSGAIVSLLLCLEKTGLPATEKVSAYALLTKVYIAVEDTAPARRTALKLLEVAPNYQPHANDPPEFKQLVDRLKPQQRPILIMPFRKQKKSGKKWWLIGGAVATTSITAAILLNRNEPAKTSNPGFTNPPERP